MMFIEVTTIYDNGSKRIKRIVRVDSIVEVLPLVASELNQGYDSSTHNKTEIEIIGARYIHCEEGYEKVKKMILKTTPTKKKKQSRFEMMDLK